MLQHVKFVEHNLGVRQDGDVRVEIRLMHVGAARFDGRALTPIQARGQQTGQAGLGEETLSSALARSTFLLPDRSVAEA
jgi:hypothetical protein